MDEAAFFTKLPSEIIFNILVRLPIKTIIVCKCVCKSWLKMLETPEFANNYHLSPSIPNSLILFEDRINENHHCTFKMWEFVDELEIEQHELHYNLVAELIRQGFKSALNDYQIVIHSSANGLLFLKHRDHDYITYICNPITCEYIEIPLPEIANKLPDMYNNIEYGFGVSKTSGQYKVVNILKERDPLNFKSIIKTRCEVYTLGTGSWRSVALECSKQHLFCESGVFFNGNLNWLITDNNDSLWISCFDLETELFNMFSGPLPSEIITDDETYARHKLVILSKDYLHLCYNTDEEVYIWMMMEYGVNKSWTHVITINKSDVVPYRFLDVYPIKVFKSGDILMSWNDFQEYFGFYSNKSKSLEILNNFPHMTSYNAAIIYVPSLVSLKCFDMETVNKF